MVVLVVTSSSQLTEYTKLTTVTVLVTETGITRLKRARQHQLSIQKKVHHLLENSQQIGRAHV